MIFLSSATGMLGGSINLKALPNSELKSNTARVNTFQALNNEVVVVHSGTTVLDSILKVSANITKEVEAKLWEMFYATTTFIFVTGQECYRVTIRKLKTDAGKLAMELYIISNELEA